MNDTPRSNIFTSLTSNRVSIREVMPKPIQCWKYSKCYKIEKLQIQFSSIVTQSSVSFVVSNSKTLLVEWLLLIFISLFWVASKDDNKIRKKQNQTRKIHWYSFHHQYSLLPLLPVVRWAIVTAYCFSNERFFHFGGKLSGVFYSGHWLELLYVCTMYV